jgi:hypothetical protein
VRSLLCLLVACLAVGVPAHAEVTVRAEIVPPRVAVGETAVLTITVEGTGSIEEDPRFSTPEALRIRGAGQSRNFSLVNGHMSQSVEIRYVVLAVKEGEHTIGPIEVRAGGRAHRIESIQFAATPGSPPPPAPGTRGSRAAPQAAGPEPLFVEMAATPPEVYVGQQVTLKAAFWQRADVKVLDARYIAPETPGFWKEELPPERSSERTRDGAAYGVTEVWTALFPTKSGTLTVSPTSVAVTYREPRQRVRDPFFPFLIDAREREVEPSSREVKVVVRPLPGGAPSGFTGAVGTYEISMRVDRTEAVQGEPLTWTLEIVGKGNVAAVEGPAFPEVPGCRAYDSGSEVETTKSNDRIGGTKKFTRVLIPETAGTIRLPVVRWAFFDPERASYMTVEARSLDLRVRPAPAGGAPEAAVRLGGAIRPIRSATRLSRTGAERPWTQFGFWAAGILPLAALGAGWFWKRRREEWTRDPARLRAREAPRRLREALDSVERDAGDPWGHLVRAVEGYLSDLYGPEVRGLTRDDLGRFLASQGGDPEESARMARLLARADALRYTPGKEAGGEQLRGALREALTCAERLGGRIGAA